MSYLNFADTKGASHIAYEGVQGDSYNFISGEWVVLEHWRNFVTGFKAVLARPFKENFLVLAFAGSDSLVDWVEDIVQAVGVLPVQYGQALHLAIECNKKHPNQLHLAGHSLGGGLAAYCSLNTDLFASTINPAPLTGAAAGNRMKLLREACSGIRNPKITNYMADGGELVSSSPGYVSGAKVRVSTKGNFITRHMIGNVGTHIPLPTKM